MFYCIIRILVYFVKYFRCDCLRNIVNVFVSLIFLSPLDLLYGSDTYGSDREILFYI